MMSDTSLEGRLSNLRGSDWLVTTLVHDTLTSLNKQRDLQLIFITRRIKQEKENTISAVSDKE